MNDTILEKILATKRQEIARLREQTSLDELRRRAGDAPPPRNFYTAMTRPTQRPLNLIAEIKKASPSKGLIREDFHPPTLGHQYETAGADAISVLTDETYFQGRLDYLSAVRQAVSLPVLRKDFIIDPWQVYQSRAAGADAILLIAAALTPARLSDLMILAAELKMTVLLEVHEADELLAVRSMIGFPLSGYSLLGINNRNLRTFDVDLNTTLRLLELADGDLPVISESGIATRQDVDRLAAAGVAGILVGETFMRQGDVVSAVNDLLGPKG